MSKKHCKLAFVGSGNMGSAIIRGFISCGGITPSDITVYDQSYTNYNELKTIGVDAVDSLERAVSDADFIFLCVKPGSVASVVLSCCSFPGFDFSSVFVSIAASVPIHLICKSAGRDVPVIRTMPNTPMMIGEGAIAVCKNELVDNRSFAYICRLFSSIAVVSVMDEAMLNPIVSVNGSSPAYVYYFIKSILDGAIAQGIPGDQALPLIIQTVIGSAKMLERANCSPDELISKVCSPRGTTLEAMNVLREEKFSDTIYKAMLACSNRADEISEELQA